MSSASSVAVIGCGIFGATIALRLHADGVRVTIFERLDRCLNGASRNNQNRLHLGFHYPRDDETGRQCLRGFARFRAEFPEAILDGFPNAYFIASRGSLTSPQRYLAFCERLGLSYLPADLAAFRPRVENVDAGVLTEEVVYDAGRLRDNVLRRLDAAGIDVRTGANVSGIRKTGRRFTLRVDGTTESFDGVVNCTYADVNRLTAELDHEVPMHQFEYTAVPVIEWDQSPVGITIMDGRFMTVLPYGQSGKFLLYHVDHTVIDRVVARQMPEHWLDRARAPFAAVDRQAFFARMVKACAEFVPALAGARLVDCLEGPRVVQARSDATDARPSVVRMHQPGYLTAFTGKIDHCLWVADEVAGRLHASWVDSPVGAH